MQYKTTCGKCRDNQIFKIDISPNNTGVYEVKCPHGHIFKIAIRGDDFIRFFDNAIYALADNYYIEAFASLVACHERFIEYFLKIVCTARGIEKSEFDRTWKDVSNQSERQLGGFIFIFLNEFHEKPKLLSDKHRGLRNKVIHKGYFPNLEDCIEYGDAVLKFIRPIIVLLRNDPKLKRELLLSISGFHHHDISHHHHPYIPFALNREINHTDEKSISDFLNDEISTRN